MKVLLTRAEKIALIVERDGPDCYLCGKPFPDRHFVAEESPTNTQNANSLTLDHVIPLAKGGTWDIENLKLAHKRCNAIKGDRLLDENGKLPVVERNPSRAEKRGARPTICSTCENGRLLGYEEMCPDCGSEPQPERYPRWAKVTPQECPHSGPWWCWACSIGLYERPPAILDVLDSDTLDP